MEHFNIRNIKKLACVSFLALLFSPANSQTDKELISDIRTVYSSTNEEINSFDKYTLTIEDESSEAGDLKIYQNKGQLVKAVLCYFGEMGKRNIEQYYKEGMLVFLFDVVSNYDKPIYVEDFKLASTEENRYYIQTGKLIKYISPEKKESWRTSIPDKEEKEKFIKNTEENIALYFNNRLLADIPMYKDKPLEELFEDRKDIQKEILSIVNNNRDVTSPLLASLAEITEDKNNTYSTYGEISWGEGKNSTYLVFDLLKNQVYIWNNLEEKTTIYSADKNYPEVFNQWIKINK